MPETATYIRTSVQTGDTSTAYQNLRVYSLDPEYVTVEKNEQGQLVVSGSFFGNASGKTYMVILAEYTEDESRIKNILVYRDEQSILEGDNTFSFTSEEISEGTHIVRPFVWTEDMEPICKAEKAKLSK